MNRLGAAGIPQPMNPVLFQVKRLICYILRYITYLQIQDTLDYVD